MPDIIPEYQPNIKEELKELSLYKFHPNGILNHSLDRLTDMLDGKVEIMDPSNPFLYLLESSCVNTAMAVQEYMLTARKLYPRLANSDEDLFLHMSDYDYMGRFGEPSDAVMVFNIDYRSFRRNAYVNQKGDRILKIPKHFQIVIDQFIYTLLAPIVIKETSNGIIDLKLELENNDTVYKYNTNYMKYDLTVVNTDESYIQFKLLMPELAVTSTEVPIEKNSLFQGKLNYEDNRQFYYFKAYYLDAVGSWKEMLVTHTEQVYDIDKPTCVIQVLQDENKIKYYIPPVYINTGKVKGKVKFVTYTTKGAISVNFDDYDTSEFKGSYNRVFVESDLDETTTPLNLTNKIFYISDLVVGGKNGVTFEQLKSDVIHNSIGDRVLPVTEKQLSYLVRSKNFKLHKDIDTITNRIYLLETDLPKNNSKVDISRFNLDIIEFRSTLAKLRNNNINDKLNRISLVGNNMIVIEKESIFLLEDGKVEPLTTMDANSLIDLPNLVKITTLNNHKYISTYYHYVLDYTTDIMDLRAYDLEKPKVLSASFDEFNHTVDVRVNIMGTPIINKISPRYSISGNNFKGYQLQIEVRFSSLNENVNSRHIRPILHTTGEVSGRYFLEATDIIRGSQQNLEGTTELDDILYVTFDIPSDLAINRKNELLLKNFKTYTGSDTTIYMDLLGELKVLFITEELSEDFQESILDPIIQGTYLDDNNIAVVSMETLRIQWGEYMERLMSRTHISVGDQIFKRAEEDIYRRYKHTIFASGHGDPIHEVGDIMKDEYGVPIVETHAGDYEYDENGDLIPIGVEEHSIYMNLMFIDYRLEVATNSAIRDYYNYTRDYLRDKITKDAVAINDELLENTESFVIVPKSINDISVETYDGTRIINSLQSFKVNVYVEYSVYTDNNVKSKIRSIIINLLDEYLSSSTELKRTVILNQLYEELKNNIESIEFERFTELNEEYISLIDKNTRIGVNKLLQIDPTGYTIEDDVSVAFMLVKA